MRLRTLYLSLILILIAIPHAIADTVTVTGIVRDSLTREPVPFATIFLPGTDRGTLTDDNGRYSITTALKWDSIQASAMGYDTKTLPRGNKRSGKARIDFDLHSTGVLLSTVIARPKKEHYTKKDNPAVRFMEKIRSTRDLGDPRRKDNYNYDKYERITLAINNYQFNDSAKGGFDKKFSFIKEYIDTSALTGAPILNVALREKASQVNYRKDPQGEKEYVKGLRQAGMDDFLDQESMKTFYEDVMREVDVYGNDVNILQNRFVSPLSRIAPDFYKFYLTDTVMVDTVSCVELTFVPRNAATFGFTGRFYVPLGDSTMFIKRIVMRVPHDINLNFINSMLISQDYERMPDGTRLKTRDDMIMEATILPGMPGMYARRNTVYTGHNFEPASDQSVFDYGQAQIYAPGVYSRDTTFWAENRTSAIAHGENSMELMIQRLRKDPVYYWGEKAIKTFASGYITTGGPSKFDIGPLTSTFSSNTVEG